MGEANVDALLRKLTPTQFLEWVAFYEIHPFGEKRADFRSAKIEARIANIYRDTKKHSKPFTVDEFLLKFTDDDLPQPKRTQTWQEQKRVAELITYAFTRKSDQKRKQG